MRTVTIVKLESGVYRVEFGSINREHVDVADVEAFSTFLAATSAAREWLDVGNILQEKETVPVQRTLPLRRITL